MADLSTEIVGGLATIAFTACGVIIHGLRDDISILEKTVGRLDKAVEILLYKDRQERRRDYAIERREPDV